jgi:hypothetical protein
MTMDNDGAATTYEDIDRDPDRGAEESWLAEQARLVLLEDGS